MPKARLLFQSSRPTQHSRPTPPQPTVVISTFSSRPASPIRVGWIRNYLGPNWRSALIPDAGTADPRRPAPAFGLLPQASSQFLSTSPPAHTGSTSNRSIYRVSTLLTRPSPSVISSARCAALTSHPTTRALQAPRRSSDRHIFSNTSTVLEASVPTSTGAEPCHHQITLLHFSFWGPGAVQPWALPAVREQHCRPSR